VYMTNVMFGVPVTPLVLSNNVDFSGMDLFCERVERARLGVGVLIRIPEPS
jgi:hypothetical protein